MRIIMIIARFFLNIQRGRFARRAKTNDIIDALGFKCFFFQFVITFFSPILWECAGN